MAKNKRYIVVPRSESVMLNGIQTGKRKINFGKQTAKWVSDPEEAREIDQQYGLKGSGDVWVHQDENLEWHEDNGGHTDGRNKGTHHFTFGPQTSKAAEEFWERYEKKKAGK